MIRRPLESRTLWMLLFLAAFGFALLASTGSGPAFAQKGGGKGGGGGGGSEPPPPPPSGTILFRVPYGHFWGMKGDGSAKSLIFPADAFDREWADVMPSRRMYGSDSYLDRWWLAPQRAGTYTSKSGSEQWKYELFAVRVMADGGVIERQLTDFPEPNPAFRIPFGTLPAWSADGLDAFLSFTANEVNQDPDDPRNFNSRHILRLHVSGLDIDAGFVDLDGNGEQDENEPSFPLTFEDMVLLGIVESVVETERLDESMKVHSWSPDGTKLTYLLRTDPFPNGSHGYEVWVTDLSDPDGPVHWPLPELGVLISDHFWAPGWSPDGTRIACYSDNSLKTIRPDGSDLVTVFQGTSTLSVWASGGGWSWSPDSTHLAVSMATRKNGPFSSWDQFVGVLPATGGAHTRLTTSDQPSFMIRSGWVSDTAANE